MPANPYPGRKIVGQKVGGGIKPKQTKKGESRFHVRLIYTKTAKGKRHNSSRPFPTLNDAEVWQVRESDRLGLTKNRVWEHETIKDVYVMQLTQGKETLFSKDHYGLVKDIVWSADWSSCTKGFYVHGRSRGTRITMHRLIVENVYGPAPTDKHAADHIGGSTTTLNNIAAIPSGSVDAEHNNLRWYNNDHNRKLTCNNTSGVNGVCWDKELYGWRVSWTDKDDARNNKLFSVRPKDDEDKNKRQKQAAIAFRRARDAETGNENGRRDA